jgi:23S rRNA pseudouridine1911/1915/1917 synthase
MGDYKAKKAIKIIFENDDLLVLDKPYGWVTTKENNKSLDNIERWLEINHKNDLPRNGIVHRLDKGTSGVLIVAKTEKMLIGLKKKFKDREITKKYIALVEGDLPMVGEMNLPISRSKYVFSKFGVNPDGKKSLTRFKVIKKFMKNERIVSMVDIDLLTGRTHQIRVHFSYLGWPILGDVLYGSKDKTIGRPILHCRLIAFDDYVFESKYEE